jgi:hypothetical protein
MGITPIEILISGTIGTAVDPAAFPLEAQPSRKIHLQRASAHMLRLVFNIFSGTTKHIVKFAELGLDQGQLAAGATGSSPGGCGAGEAAGKTRC